MNRVRRIMLAAGVHLAVVSSPALALAQNAPAGQSAEITPSRPGVTGRTPLDVVYLKSGGLFRGTIVDAVPNVRARLQLITGEIATIPWAEIDHIDRGGSPAPGTPASADKTAAAGPAHVVWLHLDGDIEEARVQEDTTGDDDWMTVCTGSCDKPLSSFYTYRVVGESIRRSAEFTLHEERGSHQSMRVESASKSAFTWGIVAAITGGVVAYAGLLILFTGAEAKSVGTGISNSSANDVMEGGGVALGVGLIGGIAGIVAAANNGKTKLIRDSSADSSAAVLRLPPAEGGLGHEAAAERAAFPKAMGIPLVGGSF